MSNSTPPVILCVDGEHVAYVVALMSSSFFLAREILTMVSIESGLRCGDAIVFDMKSPSTLPTGVHSDPS